MENSIIETQETAAVIITPEALRKHWQGHRGLTRRVIEAYPEDQFFTYSLGNMRPFAALIEELTGLAYAGIEGIVTGKWSSISGGAHLPAGLKQETKEQALQLWDETTEKIDALWKLISPEKFGESILAFGQFPGTVQSTIFYLIDNEIHHRGQAYVYLRTLGIEPPPFWDRQ